MARRPALPKTDAEMQRWCAQLEDEVAGWPAVTSRPMFGLLAFYRAKRIFAAVPRTRALHTPFSLLLKLPGVDDDRLVASGPGAGWVGFELASAADIPTALRYLGQAYQQSTRRV